MSALPHSNVVLLAAFEVKFPDLFKCSMMYGIHVAA